MKLIANTAPIIKIPYHPDVHLYIKREDLIHPQISGNKFWKIYYNLQNYSTQLPLDPMIITFGGAFSNHISAVAYVGKLLNIKTLAFIRGEELAQHKMLNPTLQIAQQNGMELQFVSRKTYENKEVLKIKMLQQFPHALILEEGGTNPLAISGIQHMLGEDTADFQYLCTAVGTGGTIAGLSKYCNDIQQVLGFKVINDPKINAVIQRFSDRKNVTLFDSDRRYGKITEENVRFINWFYQQFSIPLDPVYTVNMMRKLFELIDNNYFPKKARILAFHTGGLQSVDSTNVWLKEKNRNVIKFDKNDC